MIMKDLLFLSYLLSLFACSPIERPENPSHLSGGGWAGGGGLVRKDASNPWWVKNTTTVRYCVEIDEQNFGITQQRAIEISQKAFQWWKTAFENGADIESKYSAGVGSQTFSLDPSCSAKTDLRLQFGVLSPEQRSQWTSNVKEPPQQYRGIALRTDYDLKNMRGKGFIYLSPQSGPDKFQSKPGEIENPWSIARGELAAVTLVHELGHVFGFDHGSMDFMSPYTLDSLFLKEIASQIDELSPDMMDQPNPFQFTDDSRVTCFAETGDVEAKVFWDLPEDKPCLKLDVHLKRIYGPRTEKEVLVSVAASKEGPWSSMWKSTSFKAESAGQIPNILYLPEEQLVFQKDPSIYYWALPGQIHIKAMVELKTQDGQKARKVYLDLPAEGEIGVLGAFQDELFDPLKSSLAEDR